MDTLKHLLRKIQQPQAAHNTQPIEASHTGREGGGGRERGRERQEGCIASSVSSSALWAVVSSHTPSPTVITLATEQQSKASQINGCTLQLGPPASQVHPVIPSPPAVP